MAKRANVVSVASGLWFGAAVTGLVAALLMLLGLDTLQAMIRTIVERDFVDEAPATRDQVVVVAANVLIGGVVLVSLLQMASAAGMRSGRSGARVGLVALLVVSVVLVLLALGVVSMPTAAALLLVVALGAVGSVAMYLPAANLWFATRRP